MKVLYIDINTSGHHLAYIKNLISMDKVDPVIIVPRKCNELQVRQYEVSKLARSMNYRNYRQVMETINQIVEFEKPDLIHFLSGDMLYRYFGLYLNWFSNVIVTFHHMSFSIPRMVSYLAIFRRIKIGVVHTSYLKKRLNRIGIRNCIQIEYPCFDRAISVNKDEIREKYGIPKSSKILLAFGETRYDKGLDILLKALNHVDNRFHLIIAGKEYDITSKEIDRLTLNYREKVTKILGYIEERSMQELFAICDIVVLPYRKKFTGASGPLTTGVIYRKTIIGPDTNSLGLIISNNKIGYVFKCESVKSLKSVLEEALSGARKVIDPDAYLAKISIDVFKNSYYSTYNNLYIREN